MARVSFNSRKYSKALVAKFESFTRDKKELTKAAKVIEREIKADSRDGVGYNGRSFPDIEAETVARRRRLATVNRTNRFYKAATSNATFMGDTINKITSKVSGRKIELFGKGNHRIMKGIRVKQLKGSNAPISKILQGLGELGYKILGVSKNSNKRIAIQFRRWLRRNL